MINSLDFNDQVSSNIENVLIPSGTFAGYSNVIDGFSDIEYLEYGIDSEMTKGIELFNPFKIPSVEIVSQIKSEDSILAADKVIEEYKSDKKKIIEMDQVIVYAEKIVELGLTLKKDNYDILFCPLRGALKPTNYLKTMGVIDNKMRWLPFTGATSGKYDTIIINYIRDILERANLNSKLSVISILDTAIGGNGSNKLADLIAKVKNTFFPAASWIVKFYLVHLAEKSSSIGYINSIKSKSQEKLKFDVQRYPVNSLIVEDWESAIGLKVDFQGNSVLIKNSIQEGKIIVLDSEKVSVIETPEISNYIDVLVASTISNEIITHPKLKFIRDIWPEYMDKG